MTEEDDIAHDNRLGRRRAALRWLFVAGLIAVSVQGLALLRWAEPQVLPVRAVIIDGEVHRHSLSVLQETVAAQLTGGIVLVDLAAIKEAVEALPWVAAVSLRRVWPERLELRVIEHRPMARWGADGLVTATGEVFRPDPDTIPDGLPLLVGDDREAGRVVARYFEWRERLAPLNLEIAALALDARGAWRMGLHNGMELALGSRAIDERVARFIQAYPSLRLAGLPVAVDLRYANGLAVRWVEGGARVRSAAAGTGEGISRGRS
ncbi:cell division protein FtsQ/DivIB [Thiococcus pfennigii]|jgi:cell division protein FtsQ|uniref:cell division protein FtsQ/DivIB n=1 Tax=Thiococcus pfennigii TaxID=1057 RepID=UPI0019043F84|nr:cell division protein FtsQ/DivIB [Thiococcus pfennigii]MBK1701368.1 cell division protein FtsQ [Thiococcus pfennigii]MBK1731521.1 cell division protein FtsQ [Thiococcus pfennigii]